MAELSFIFGKGQKARTPEEARRLREFAEALMGSQRAPQNVGEGLMALANGLSARFAHNAARRATAEGRTGAESKVGPIFSALFGSKPVSPVTPSGNRVAEALGGKKNDGSGNLPSRFDFANAEAVTPGGSVRAAGKGWTEIQMADGSTVRREGSRNWRNNNPGNIEYGNFAKGSGAIGTDGRFAVFPTYEAGRTAKAKLIFESPNYRNKSIAGVINRYAPPSENNTNAYTGAVASAIGVSPDTPVSALSPQQREMMLDAMERVEGFKVGRETVIGSAGTSSLAGGPADDVLAAAAEQGLPADNPGVQALAALRGQEDVPQPIDPTFNAGEPATTTPAGKRVISALFNKQPMGGSPMATVPQQPPAVVSPQRPMPQVPQGIAPSRFDGPGSLGDPGVQAALAAQRAQQPQEQGPGPLQAISRAFGFGGQPQPQGGPQAAPQPSAQEFLPQPPAPDAGGNGALSMENLYRVLQDPWVEEGTKRVILSEIQRQQEMQDPAYQMELEKSRLELEALRNPKPGEEWAKLDDNRLFNQRTGEIRSLPGGPAGGAFRFQGNSVEAQSLNGLMDANILTPEQAMQLGAGKTVSGPNGEIIFMTPQGVFGQQAGQPPQPIVPPAATGAPAAPQASPAPPQAVPPPQVQPQAQPAPQPAPVPAQPPQQTGQRPGMIPLTGGKPEKPTEAQKNRLSNVGQAKEAIINELDRYQALVEKHGVEVLPGKAKDNLNTVRQGIMLQLKELFELGVLNGPDLSLMERMIYDPVVDPLKEGGIANLPDQLWTGAFGGAGDRAKNSVAELKRMIGSISDSVGNNMPERTGAPAPAGNAGGWSNFGNVKIRVKPQ